LQQSGNTEIINAQLFLMLKYLENEVRLHKDNNNINPFTIAVDEAHLLIDRKNPIALNFMFQMTKRIRKYNGNLIVITQNINDFVGDETIKKYSTGIINNCQYAMIFRLNPGDLGDLKTLFSNNPLSDAEINEIAIMPRGNCLFAVTSNQKFNLKITAFDKEREQFELLEEQKTTKH
jgi:type IV secretory pathway VirB4 component